MEAGWGATFLQRFRDMADDAIATVLTRDNREFYAHSHELEILTTFPTAWVFTRGDSGSFEVIPESEIVRVSISGA